MRIALDDIVVIDADTLALQALPVRIRRTLTRIVRDDHRADHEPAVHELVAQTQHVLVVGDTQILTYLISFDIQRREHDHDLQRVLQLREHLQFTVRHEARQYPTRVQVVEEFTA